MVFLLNRRQLAAIRRRQLAAIRVRRRFAANACHHPQSPIGFIVHTTLSVIQCLNWF